ncbi:hypothetical protein AMATHDRAFT_66406 [Amanita thiersii Skay4041]|uniref:Uncharacterized protein n=1 Tax=Amanita thiersii Skay4041 TaxID=703135 RepID=A0A2A9NJX4_9AGAR|nr:hypothetical protein AMATHDRAFT_66406 [Amanita thiersii Skay4041]
MSLQSGCYYITNVKHKNVAHLANSDLSESLRGKPDPSVMKDSGEKWKVSLQGNGKYIIENILHTSFATITDTYVEAVRPDSGLPLKLFKIEQSKTSGQYTISPADGNQYWCLDDVTPGTPIKLSAHSSDSSCQWIFTIPPQFELHCKISFDNSCILCDTHDPPQLKLQNEGIISVNQWAIVLYSFKGSKYLIKDIRSGRYASPNAEHTSVTTSVVGFVWTIKPHSPGHFTISMKHDNRELTWSRERPNGKFIILADASQIQGNSACKFNAPSFLTPPATDSKTELTIGDDQYAGRINCPNPDIRKQAIESIDAMLHHPETQITYDLLEALVLLLSHSSPSIQQQVKAALRSLPISTFTNKLDFDLPVETRILPIKLLGFIIDGPGDYKLDQDTILGLIDDFSINDDKTVISLCRIFSKILPTLASLDLKIAVPAFGRLLCRKSTEVVLEALKLLDSTLNTDKWKIDVGTLTNIEQLTDSETARIRSPAIKLQRRINKEKIPDDNEDEDDSEDEDEDGEEDGEEVGEDEDNEEGTKEDEDDEDGDEKDENAEENDEQEEDDEDGDEEEEDNETEDLPPKSYATMKKTSKFTSSTASLRQKPTVGLSGRYRLMI